VRITALEFRAVACIRSETTWPARIAPAENPAKNPVQCSYMVLKGDKRIAENSGKMALSADMAN
jgi:hypothetical protein